MGQMDHSLDLWFHGDIPNLQIKLIEKFEKVNHQEMFRFIENYFETSKKSVNLFTSSEAYNISENQKSNIVYKDIGASLPARGS